MMIVHLGFAGLGWWPLAGRGHCGATYRATYGARRVLFSSSVSVAGAASSSSSERPGGSRFSHRGIGGPGSKNHDGSSLGHHHHPGDSATPLDLRSDWMRAVILAAGYGTRLEKDVRADTTGSHDHLVGCPKPLLPVGALPLASHWMRALREANASGRHVEHVYVVTNELFHAKFKAWAQDYGPFVTVVNDGTTRNEERLGAIACLQLVVEQCGLQEDHAIVIGGDTLFYEDFNLSDVIDRFSALQEHTGPDCSLVLSYSCADHETTKFGILEVDETQKVTAFLEKPSAVETSSRRACPCFYVYAKHALPLLKDFLHERKDAPLEARDAPGTFLAWLYQRKPVYTFEVSGRFDVGGLQSYLACHQHFLDRDVSLGSAQTHAAT